MESSIHLQSLTALSIKDTKRIPAAEPLWIELSELKSAGQTCSQFSEEMIEAKKRIWIANAGSLKIGHDPVLIDLSLFQAG